MASGDTFHNHRQPYLKAEFILPKPPCHISVVAPVNAGGSARSAPNSSRPRYPGIQSQ